MRSKTPLVLMEQMIMLLVFALASALCLQAFVKSDHLSQRSEDRDRALQAAQNAAEVLQNTGGDFSQAAALLNASGWEADSLTVFYGNNWNPIEPLSAGVYPLGYTLGVHREAADVPGLGQAEVWVQDDETGEDLVRFSVAWQEEVDVRG